jgi:apolipoprotein D and lipocalin family protein
LKFKPLTLPSLALALVLLAVPWVHARAQAQAPSPPPLRAIESLDVPRYMGRWYEIAKFPNWFQRQCVGNTSANYSLRPDGQVQVLNECRRQNGEMEQALGQARQLGPATSPRLQVRFAPQWLSLLPFVWGDYWVIDLDERYELVAVSEPKREYLWVLSRTPVVDEARYAALLTRLTAQGLDVRRLESTPQR